MDKLETLRRYFGHASFRAGQETMVDALLSGRDAMGVMPTGAGKSMCYQIPALMLPGITLVISPLISLMADQVAALKSAGVPAAYLNSTLSPRQMELALERAYQGAYKIIYVAPERLEAPSFIRFAQHAPIALVAVDEAHCVSQWGQDFRPVYLRIADFVDLLPRRPVMGAFTATATQRVREDIVRHLRLVNPATVTTGFDRPNLYFEVVRLKKRDPALMQILADKRGQSGIIYCATRKSVEEVCDKLCGAGYAAGRYHAGLPDEERKQNQEDFQYDRVQIMVATNAFGMGIDKSNVRFVIHYNMPKSMEAYYQEAGRAGRDGEPSECILLYNAQDIITGRWMINNSPPNEALSAAEQARVRQLDMQRLQSMIDYCTRDQCLRGYILRYFGETAVEERCGDCGFCTGGRYGEAPAVKPAKQRRTAAAEKSVDVGCIEGAGDLFEQLRAVRMALAKKQHVPPYVICSDATLNSMCRVKPQTKEGMLSVSGMGEIKTAKYGEAFLKVLRAHEAASRKTRRQVNTLARQSQMTYTRAGKPSASPAAAPAYRSVRIIEPPQTAPLPPPRPPLEDDDEALADAYLSGVSIQEMADELGMHPSEIRHRLQELDLIF